MKECQHCKICYTDDVDTCPKDGMPTMHTLSGEPVLEGKYKLESRVGQGGMGVVYKARHAYLKTVHAIKIILPDLVGNDPQLVTRFRQEALAAAAIRHQNVVQVTDYGVVQGTMPFLVMEFVEGEDLHDFLEREKRLSPERSFELISAICRGIGAAHKQGIVHRDMKPLNIMLLKGVTDMSAAVKILDFGLAKIKSGELLGSFIQAKTTGLMGSPYYMAPEQWSDEELDARSDIYSIGVMLFQMLAGKVPFKGSSIPAVMKKHLSDPPPSFSDMGVEIDPGLEKAVRHTLEKNRENRTETVELLIEELSEALGKSSQAIAVSGQTAVSFNVLTNPPKSIVYLDNVLVGESKADGWLAVEGVQNGDHALRVEHDGFQNWEQTIVCDGKLNQVVAELKAGSEADRIPKPEATIVSFDDGVSQDTPHNLSQTQQSSGAMQNTADQNMQTGSVDDPIEKGPKSSIFSPVVIAVIGIFVLFGLTGIGGVGAYMFGLFGGTKTISDTNPNVSPTPTQTDSNDINTPPEVVKNEMIRIPGGEMKMGRNDGQPQERPEHRVDVAGFWMDKTEVTNAEYYQFVKDSGHDSTPANWERGKPLASDLKMPVRFVSHNDAIDFVAWRSNRDNLTYRLPTEQEWEFAARNGSQNNLYPWGDDYKSECAVLDQQTNEPKQVGSSDCGTNKWGVHDLIGNVFEWTSSEAGLYPGNDGQVQKTSERHFMIRGGASNYKSTGPAAITSTFRTPIAGTKKDAGLGFRLVRSG